MYDYQTYWNDRNWVTNETPKLDLPKCKSVLDIGCGDGRFYLLFKCEYKGVDICRMAINKAQQQYPEGDFEVVDLLNYQPEKKYDLVFSYTCLEHIPAEYIETFAKALSNWGTRMIAYEPMGSWNTASHCYLHDYEKLFNVIKKELITKEPPFYRLEIKL